MNHFIFSLVRLLDSVEWPIKKKKNTTNGQLVCSVVIHTQECCLRDAYQCEKVHKPIQWDESTVGKRHIFLSRDKETPLLNSQSIFDISAQMNKQNIANPLLTQLSDDGLSETEQQQTKIWFHGVRIWHINLLNGQQKERKERKIKEKKPNSNVWASVRIRFSQQTTWQVSEKKIPFSVKSPVWFVSLFNLFLAFISVSNSRTSFCFEWFWMCACVCVCVNACAGISMCYKLTIMWRPKNITSDKFSQLFPFTKLFRFFIVPNKFSYPLEWIVSKIHNCNLRSDLCLCQFWLNAICCCF